MTKSLFNVKWKTAMVSMIECLQDPYRKSSQKETVREELMRIASFLDNYNKENSNKN